MTAEGAPPGGVAAADPSELLAAAFVDAPSSVDVPATPAAAAAARLAAGRLLTTVAILILSFDTPTYRLVKTKTPADDALSLGLAINVWRGSMYCLASAIALRHESSSWAQLFAAVRLLGWKRLLFGALMLGGSGVCFCIAVALTTATNVLVIIAMMPLACALSGHALGTRLPRHTWVASVFGACSVALVFATGIKAGPEQTKGCLLALGVRSFLLWPGCFRRSLSHLRQWVVSAPS